MKSIIGLLEHTAIHSTIEQLNEAGVPGEKIGLINTPGHIKKVLACDPACIARTYGLWGAGIGVGIYAVLGISAAFCECSMLNYGQQYGFLVFIGAILSGTVIGGILGGVWGMATAEEKSLLYVQGIDSGAVVIQVNLPIHNIEKVKRILTNNHSRGVKVIPNETT